MWCGDDVCGMVGWGGVEYGLELSTCRYVGSTV